MYGERTLEQPGIERALREHSIFSAVLTKAIAPYYVEAWRRALVNTLEKIECSLIVIQPAGQVTGGPGLHMMELAGEDKAGFSTK